MERKSFLKALGAVCAAVVMPKFLFGEDKSSTKLKPAAMTIPQGSYDISCHAESESGFSVVRAERNVSECVLFKDEGFSPPNHYYTSFIHNEINGSIQLYYTDNINAPRRYEMNKESNFMFKEFLSSDKRQC